MSATFDYLPISSFKAYDVRGELGKNLDEAIAYRIGRAFAQILCTQTDPDPLANKKTAVVIGCDVRPSSEALKQATIAGIVDAGVDVIDLGMTGTEEVYFATAHLHALGGIEVTASHNPINYNGLKLVRENAKPISAETGLKAIQALAESGDFITPDHKGQIRQHFDKSAYIDHLFGYLDRSALSVWQDRPLKLVINSGNGSAAPVVDALADRFLRANLPIEIIRVHHEPDGSFPNGIPNPMIVANRKATSEAVVQAGADLGIAFDGDFDRCFLFDETGAFVENSYVVGLLAQAFLRIDPSAGIVYDPRVIYNTEAILAENAKNPSDQAILSQSGHSFIKQKMRETGATYGGEMSAHHYFRDFFYCDSGMIPWLLVLGLIKPSKPLSVQMADRIHRYPTSGELNFRLTDLDAAAILRQMQQDFLADQGDFVPEVSHLDGLSMAFADWRFNLRASNTEPLIRLNLESRGDRALLDQKVQAIKTWLADRGAVLVE